MLWTRSNAENTKTKHRKIFNFAYNLTDSKIQTYTKKMKKTFELKTVFFFFISGLGGKMYFFFISKIFGNMRHTISHMCIITSSDAILKFVYDFANHKLYMRLDLSSELGLPGLEGHAPQRFNFLKLDFLSFLGQFF